ncbi:DNA polymerase I [Eggerthellaceae bacterium 3-80]|nr:DNA polymerase I [bacterium D16-34]
MTKKIAVIDGNSLMHRAFHAVPPTMNAPDGTPTNAVFGFMAMLLKFMDGEHPDAIVCAFDAGRPEFRMKAIEGYKAQRPPMDPDLKAQFPLIEKLLEAMDVPVVRIDGWEGDDILGTIAARDEALGYETLLVTGDKDAYQLASDLTRIVTTKKGVTDIAIYGPDEVKERYGVTPEQVPDYLGLKGDSSDNIPGVAGIGEKTAAKLLQAYGSLEGLYAHTDELKGKQKERIEEHKEDAFASRKVATIIRDLDFDLDLENIAFPSFDPERVKEAFEALRFSSHLTRVLKLTGHDTVSAAVDLVVEPQVSGAEAAALLEAALANHDMVGIAYQSEAQTTLFSTGLHIAIATKQGIALFDDEQAKDALKQVVADGEFAALDVKALIEHIYPKDTSELALVNDETLLNMRAFDIGLAGYVLNSSESEYSLDNLLNKYLGKTLPEAKNDQVALVNAAAAIRVLKDVLEDELERNESTKAYFDIDLPLVAVLAIMERTGAALDVDRLAKLGASTQIELDDLRKRIWELAGEEFNVDSPKQLSHILFEVLGLPPIKKNSRGYSTDAGVLKELSKSHELPALVLHYRELAKIKSTYIDALPRMLKADNRIHTTYNETVTTTGRLSSSDPNLQNIPIRTEFGRHIRECFVPLSADEVYVSADYSQIELRLLAHLSQDEHLIAAFNSGEDFHAQTASHVFGVPIEQVTPELRSRAKAVNFGIVYGQQAFGLSQSLDIPFGEAKEMIDRYFEAYPQVRRYLDDTIEHAKQKGYAQTMFARKRHIPELKATNAAQRGFGERTAMNHPMQGSAADIIKLAMTEVQRRLEADGYRAKLLVQVHDELDLSVPQDELERLCEMVKSVMESVVELSVPLVVDIGCGKNWAEAH